MKNPGAPGVLSTTSEGGAAGESREISALGPPRLEVQHGKAVPAIEDYRSVMVQRAVFQGLASMGLPAFTIHSIVRYSGRALKGSKRQVVRTWGPIGVCLCSDSFLPFLVFFLSFFFFCVLWIFAAR